LGSNEAKLVETSKEIIIWQI